MKYVHIVDVSFAYTFPMELFKWTENRVVSRAILATAMIVPALHSNKVFAENGDGIPPLVVSNYYIAYDFNNWNIIVTIIHGP